jgi:hypothetical protein
MKYYFPAALSLLLVIILLSASSSAVQSSSEPTAFGSLNVWGINGPPRVTEGKDANYRISAGKVKGISYSWTCESPGSISKQENPARATFHAGDVSENTDVVITVVVSAPGYSSVTCTKVVNIINTNR